MQTTVPTLRRLLVMVAFALSCFGILLYLWLVFGGPIPLKPQGYRVHVPFEEATQLAEEADVRISGVRVGKVKAKRLAGSRTDAELEIEERYAPIARDSRAILRQKTLLGETYVELTPGTRSAARLPDGGALAAGQVSPTVQLDEIFRTFDRRTRADFGTWLDQQGTAVGRRGEDLNDALGNLAPFATDTRRVLDIVESQRSATGRLVRNTGEVFAALTERQGQLRGLIEGSNRLFSVTARRDRELAEAITALPTFLVESRRTVARVRRFAEQTDPLITQLRPAARELSPTIASLDELAPDLRDLFRGTTELAAASRRGLPALTTFLDDLRPLLAQLEPFLRNVNPFLDWVGLYKREIAAFFANDSAATQTTDIPPGAPSPVHYLRTTNPVNPEVLAAYPRRLDSNRSNPYVAPGGYRKLGSSLEVFAPYLCTSNEVPRVSPDADITPELRELIERFVYKGERVAVPPCRVQEPLGRQLDQEGLYPHVDEAPPR